MSRRGFVGILEIPSGAKRLLLPLRIHETIVDRHRVDDPRVRVL